MTALWRRAARTLAALALLGSTGCAGLSQIARAPAAAPHISTASVTLRGQPFELHLAVPPRPRATDLIVLYASGDGGWFGAAVDMFRAVGGAGFYAVGVSSRALMHHKRPGGQPLTVADLAEDYTVILEQAARLLNLPPQRRVVLTGWSRGASLAVLVGEARHAPATLAGVIAIGLDAHENLAVSSETDDDPADRPQANDTSSLDTYALLGRIAPGRCAVIQASGDSYLPASQARQLFGADTDLRRFYEVAAKNHRFSGGAEAFDQALRSALSWVIGEPPAAGR